MTREEAISLLTQVNKILVNNNSWLENTHEPLNMAFDMAIKVLEQEPCEDAISRQATIDAFGLSEKTRKFGGDHSGYDTMMLYEIQDTIESMPSVNPQTKTGHWIPVSERWPEENGYYLITTVYHEVYCDYWGEDCFDRTETVVAWMPLPKPYGLQKGKDINVGNQT